MENNDRHGIIFWCLIIFMTVVANLAQAQKIVKNEKDEFTGDLIKETSWEVFQMASKNYSYVRVRKINSDVFLNFKAITHKIVSIGEGEPLMFKFIDDEVVELENLDFTIASRGSGSTGLSWRNVPGVSLNFHLNDDAINKIAETPIVKTRLYTSQGYIEGNVKEKFDDKLKKMIQLIIE